MTLLVKDFYKGDIRVRFAPSPTGYMHLGNMRTAIINYFFAQSMGGKFLLRIEDTDKERSQSIYEESILNLLTIMGIHWDEPIVYQSKNIAYHQKIAYDLLDKKRAYYCQCPSKNDEEFHKICPCESKIYSNGAVRFKVGDNPLEFNDFIMGKCKTKGQDIQDFIILRNDGSPTYNLSVVCDDNTMKITHIIRGNDHLSNTFKQVAIYEAMGWLVPWTAHLPLIINGEGKKLSKRDGDITIKHYLEIGLLPETIISFLIRLGWSYKDQEIFTTKELLTLLPLGKFQKSSACYNESKFLFQNKHFLKEKNWIDVKPYVMKYLNINNINNELMAIKGFDLIKSRCNLLSQLSESMVTYIPEKFTNHYEKKSWNENNQKSIEILQQYFNQLTKLNEDYLESYNQLNLYIQNYNLEPKDYQQNFRYILTKELVGPHIMEIVHILGLSEVQKRLNNYSIIG